MFHVFYVQNKPETRFKLKPREKKIEINFESLFESCLKHFWISLNPFESLWISLNQIESR